MPRGLPVPFLRLLRHPHHHLRRRAGLPAGHRPVRRPHQARRRLLFASGATVPGDCHHAQDLRRARRDELKHIRGDVSYAWPTAEIAVMGPKGAVEISIGPNSATRPDRRPHQKLSGPSPTVQRRRAWLHRQLIRRATRAAHTVRWHAAQQDRRTPGETRQHSALSGGPAAPGVPDKGTDARAGMKSG